MKRFIMNSLVVFPLLLLGGCSFEVSPNNKIEPEGKISINDTSILDYKDSITGENFETGILEISKEKDYIQFKLKTTVSTALQKKILHTKETFYFNITDITGKKNLSNVTIETPVLTPCNLNTIRNDDFYLITQSIRVKKNLTPEELKPLMLPSNYELQFVTSDKQVVAKIIGLETNTMD